MCNLRVCNKSESEIFGLFRTGGGQSWVAKGCNFIEMISTRYCCIIAAELQEWSSSKGHIYKIIFCNAEGRTNFDAGQIGRLREGQILPDVSRI